MTPLLDTRRPLLLLVLLCLLLWLPGFFTLPAGDRDESRFAQATKQMMETGDLVRISNGTEERNRKPIGIHWLQLAPVAVMEALDLDRGNPIWPYRVPSLLGGLAAVLACYAVGLRLLDRRTALLGAAMLAASVVLTAETHIAKTDAVLLAATTLAMAMLARAWAGGIGKAEAAVFWLAAGLGILVKGPITPMVAGLTVVALVVTERRAAWLRDLRPAWGVPLLLAVVLPWFAAIGVATEGRFFSDAIGGDLGRKLSSGDDSHWGPPGLHAMLALVLLFPSTAAVPGAAVLAWRDRRVAEVRFLLAWLLPAWLVFEAVPTKLPHYTLPLYPALCLLLARAVVAVGGGLHGRVGRGGAWLAGAVGLLLMAAALAAPPLLHMPAWLGAPAAAGVLVASVLAAVARDGAGAMRAVLGAALLYAGILGWELPRLIPLWIGPLVARVLPPGRLGSVGYAEPSLMFLVGTDTRWLRPEEAVPEMLAGSVDVLLVGDRDLGRVLVEAAAQKLLLERRGEVTGFNYSRGRWVTLTVLVR